MNISEIMTQPVLTVGLDDSVSDIEEIFIKSKVRHILVVEEGELFGVVSERDLLRAMNPYLEARIYTTRDLAALNQRVHQIVIRKPIALNVNASIDDVINTFKNIRVGCIPILDDNNWPVGVVTRGDIFKFFDEICACYYRRDIS